MGARRITSTLAVLGAGALLAAACGPSDFDPSTKLESVRVLATRADQDNAYPAPGADVTLRTLAIDSRKDTSRAMKIYWLPYVCQNPLGDSYAACFAPSAVADAGVSSGADAGSGGAGAGASLGGLLQPGTDLTPFLPTGPTFQVHVPADGILQDHNGVAEQYGLLIVFNIACAGRVKVKPVDPSTGPQQVPLGCFDDAGTELGPDDYVIGFTRLFVHAPADPATGRASRANANPVITNVKYGDVDYPTMPDPAIPPTLPGGDLPAPIGIVTPACRKGCAKDTMEIALTDASWELDPDDLDGDGNPRHEAIWVDFYATAGDVDSEARLLYDATTGKITGTSLKYTPPAEPGEAAIYAVVHDNRDGVTWIRLDVRAQ